MTNYSLPDAKKIADETGKITSTSDKNKALKWYYTFAGTDSILQITNLHTYGCFKTECKKPKDEAFTVFKDHIGQMQAEAEAYNHSQNGSITRVIKEEMTGSEILDLKTLPKIDSNMVVAIMRDMLGYSNEQLEKLIREDDLVVKGIDRKTKEALEIVYDVLSQVKNIREQTVAPQPVPVVKTETKPGIFYVSLYKAGNEKVKAIKAIRHLTGKGLIEAKKLTEELGFVGNARDKEDALYWYYQFTQSDYGVHVSGIEPYGHYNVEIRKPEDYEFRTAITNTGKLHAEEKAFNYSQNGFVSRVVKTEMNGDKSMLLKQLFSLSVYVDRDILEYVLHDMFGIEPEETKNLERLDHLTHEDIDALKYAAKILSDGSQSRLNEKYEGATILLRADEGTNEKDVWDMILNSEGGYLVFDGNPHSITPWLDMTQSVYLIMKPMAPEKAGIKIFPNAGEAFKYASYNKEQLLEVLQYLVNDGIHSVCVYTPRFHITIDTDKFLKHADCVIEEYDRTLRQKIYHTGLYSLRYANLPEEKKTTTAGDYLFSAFVNAKFNLNRWFVRSVVYAFSEVRDSHDGVTVYSQNAWNRVQGWMTENPDIDGKMTAEGDTDTIVIPKPAGFHTLLSKDNESYLPVYTTKKEAKEAQKRYFPNTENLCIVAVTFDDLMVIEDKVKGIIVDHYRINKEEFKTIEKLINVNQDIPLWYRVRNSSRKDFKRYELEDIQVLESISTYKRVWHDQVLHKWRLTIPLDDQGVYFLSVFIEEDGNFDKYSLDCELASDSHYEFFNEKEIRKLLYQEKDEDLYLDEIFSRYLRDHTGDKLIELIGPFITATYHFD